MPKPISYQPVDHPLYQRFADWLRQIEPTISSEQILTPWRRLVSRYSEAHRHYHTLTHLERMFADFDIVMNQLYSPSLVALAIFYHDIIYDPKQSDNEAHSAEFMQTELRFYLQPKQIAQIKSLIMMTASHKLVEIGGIRESDSAYFLDLDLSILGSTWDEYQQYAKAVRLEYRHVAEDDYQQGRVSILQSLLAHNRLYLSDDYFERLESVARDNIYHELELLAV